LLARAQATPEVERNVRTLYEQGDWAGAISAAYQANPLSKDLYLYQGLALARLGRLDEAERVFLRARRIYPDDPRFALELAGVEYRNKDHVAAKQYLHKALRLAPADHYTPLNPTQNPVMPFRKGDPAPQFVPPPRAVIESFTVLPPE